MRSLAWSFLTEYMVELRFDGAFFSVKSNFFRFFIPIAFFTAFLPRFQYQNLGSRAMAPSMAFFEEANFPNFYLKRIF